MACEASPTGPPPCAQVGASAGPLCGALRSISKEQHRVWAQVRPGCPSGTPGAGCEQRPQVRECDPHSADTHGESKTAQVQRARRAGLSLPRGHSLKVLRGPPIAGPQSLQPHTETHPLGSVTSTGSSTHRVSFPPISWLTQSLPQGPLYSPLLLGHGSQPSGFFLLLPLPDTQTSQGGLPTLVGM